MDDVDNYTIMPHYGAASALSGQGARPSIMMDLKTTMSVLEKLSSLGSSSFLHNLQSHWN